MNIFDDTNPDTPAPPRAFRLIVKQRDGSSTETNYFGSPTERETRREIARAGTDARWDADGTICRVRAWR